MQWKPMRILVMVAAVLLSMNVSLPASEAQGGTPDRVVEAFLDAWNNDDLETMYSYVSARSTEQYDFETFRARYNEAQTALAFGGVTYTLNDLHEQGTSASVRYDAVLTSNTFGDIEDTDRIIRLVDDGSGWKIAWTPQDILKGLAPGVSIRPQRDFPPRANIYDRDGEYLVQENGSLYQVSVREQDMADTADCTRILAEYMLRPVTRLQNLFTNYLPDANVIVGEITREVFDRNRGEIDEVCGTDIAVPELGNRAKIQGVSGRAYYGHGAAAHVTGYIGFIPQEELDIYQSQGYTENDTIGRYGVEREYQQTLAGQPEQTLRLIEPGGTVIRELGSTSGSPPTPVQLTVDRDLQWTVSKAINDAYNYAQSNWAPRSNGAGAVVLDVDTGGVLALASYPTFDPRLFNPDRSRSSFDDSYDGGELSIITSDVRNPLRNKAVQDPYFPGSTFKIVTTIAAADSGVWNPQQEFDCQLTWSGQEEFGDVRELREDWRLVFERDPAGIITMPQALTTSCNPFFWEMGGLLYQRENDLLAQYSEQLGFGSPTGIGQELGLSAPEAAGNIPRPQQNPTEAINNAIGQGNLTATVMQMGQLVAAVANGGTLYEPHLVSQVGGFDGTNVQETMQPRGEPLDIDPNVIDVVQQGMCDVPVNEDLGTSYTVFSGNEYVAPYTSCGKTGSAQAGTPDSGIPPHSWYVAYAPADDPEIAVAVLVTTSREGSDVAAPIVRRVFDQYFGADVKPYPQWWEGEYEPVPVAQGIAPEDLNVEEGGEGDS